MRLYLVSALAVFLMAGCGGSSSPKGSDQEKTTSLKGIAVDDLIVNGKVRAYAASTSKELAKGRTDNGDGSYVLNIAYDGVVIVEVTCDANSKMLNPATGIKKDCIQGLELNSAATVKKDSKDVKVNISPLTELVVRQMKESGTTSKASLQAAQSNIGEMFGFDPLGQSPVENDQYKKVINAIHSMADKDSSKTILDVIDDLNSDYKDGKAGDSGTKTSQKFAQEMKAVGANNNLTRNDGTYEPTDNSNLSDIELSKKFFGDLRTQAMSVVDYKDSGTAGFLDKEAESLGTALEAISMDLGTASSFVTNHVTKILDLVENNETNKTFTYRGGEKTITYTKTSNPKVWTYSVIESEDEKNAGTVTLPTANIDDISLKDFTGTLNVKFDGTVPLRLENGSSVGSQSINTDISLVDKPYGADLLLTNVSVSSSTTLLALKNLNLSAYYTFDSEDKLVPNHLIFRGATLSGSTGGYSLNGKLEIPEYVQNNSLKDNDFMEDIYETYIHASAFCLDEHNQRMDLSDGIATYTDASDIEHIINSNQWGSFYANIDGNVGNLNPDDYRHGNQNLYYGDRNYSKYVGLKFDNISMQSESCPNIVLENLGVEFVDEKTSIYGQIFCVDGENKREFDFHQDENGTPISDVVASFTDANSVSHPFSVHGGSINTQYNGNSENITLDSGRHNIFPNQQGFINFERITIESDCENPILNQLQFSFEPDNNSQGEVSIYTKINGSFSCMDNNMNSYIPEATITYTDKSGTQHQSNNDNYYNEGLRYDGGNFHGKIKGNVEEIQINMGRKSYNAAGFLNTVESDDIIITSNSCANPKLSYFNIGLDHDEDFFNSGYLPKKVSFDGNITNANGSAISGNVSIDWLNAKTINLLKNSDKSILVDIDVTGKIKMPDSPEMILNLGFENSATENDFTFNYAYGSTSITGTGDFDQEVDNGTILLSSHNGLSVTIKVVEGDVVYGSESSVTRNGTLIGTLEDKGGVPVIEYTDDTFESLP